MKSMRGKHESIQGNELCETKAEFYKVLYMRQITPTHLCENRLSYGSYL